MKKNKLKKILRSAVPLWLVVVLIVDFSLMTNLAQYYVNRQERAKLLTQLKDTTKDEELITLLKQEVLPQGGYKTSVAWQDLGKQLVEIGAIDRQKFEESFVSDADGKDHLKYLDGYWDEPMQINEKNARFMVDFLWALGLANKSKVLDEGPMRQDGVETENVASTGGWTLGSKEPMQLYSSAELVKLTPEQHDLVRKIADNVFRPCCGNSTSFPDCNHGMAALGYIELAVKNGVPENQIYRDIVALNSYWFPQTYVEIAASFNRDLFLANDVKTVNAGILGQFNFLSVVLKQDKKSLVKWDSLDPKVILSEEYSSGRGSQQIKQSIQDLPAFQTKNSGGGSCGA